MKTTSSQIFSKLSTLKKRLTLVCVFFGLLVAARGVEIKDGDVFLSEINGAIARKDLEKLNQLTYSIGASDDDKVQVAKSYRLVLFHFQNREIKSIRFAPLPRGFQQKHIVRGKCVDLTYQPTGAVELLYETSIGRTDVITFLYSIIKGSYFIVSAKSAELD